MASRRWPKMGKTEHTLIVVASEVLGNGFLEEVLNQKRLLGCCLRCLKGFRSRDYFIEVPLLLEV